MYVKSAYLNYICILRWLIHFVRTYNLRCCLPFNKKTSSWKEMLLCLAFLASSTLFLFINRHAESFQRIFYYIHSLFSFKVWNLLLSTTLMFYFKSGRHLYHRSPLGTRNFNVVYQQKMYTLVSLKSEA